MYKYTYNLRDSIFEQGTGDKAVVNCSNTCTHEKTKPLYSLFALVEQGTFTHNLHAFELT